MPPDIRTGPTTLAAGTPPGRAFALLAPPGSDPLAALFASLLAGSGGPAAPSPKAALTPGEAPKGKPQAVPLLPAPIKIRPNTPLTAGVTAGPKKTEQKGTEPKTAEKTMDTSPVPASPDRDKAGAKPSGELPLQGAGANSSGPPALPILLYVPPMTTPALTATDRVLSLPAGQGQMVAASSLPLAETGSPLTAPVVTSGSFVSGEAAPEQVSTALATATITAALPQVTLAALGAAPATPAAPFLTELTVTEGPTAKEGKSAMDDPSARDGKAATEGRTATAGSLITEGQSTKEGRTARDGKVATAGPIARDEQSAKDGGTATDGRFIANVQAATDGKNAKDSPVAMEGPIAMESEATTDGRSATDGKSAKDGLTATDGKMLTAGEPKTGLKSAAAAADTITRAQAVQTQAKAVPTDLQPLVSGTRSERRAGSVSSDAPPPLPAQAPAQAVAVSTETKPLSAADRAEVIRQAADGVGAMPLPAKPGTPEQMTLQLHPKEWGQLQVSVTITPGSHPNAVQAVTAHIVAQNPQVKAALEGQSGDLRQALREAGLHLDRISVTVQSMEASAQIGDRDERRASRGESRRSGPGNGRRVRGNRRRTRRQGC